MNNNLEFENENPSPDSIEDNHPRTNYGEGFSKQETLEEVIGKKATDYCEQYKGTDKYNVAMLAIEFGYQLAKEEPKLTTEFQEVIEDC
jgi:hypothetical protein